MNDYYKIRRVCDGLFSEGGTKPTVSEQGTQWNSKELLDKYLKKFPSIQYIGCDVVTYRFIPLVVERVSVPEYTELL